MWENILNGFKTTVDCSVPSQVALSTMAVADGSLNQTLFIIPYSNEC